MRRIYRRICVLRGVGSNDEAATLEHTELPRALAAARLATDNHSEEAAVFHEEAERVASAQLVAELMAPLLARQLRAELPALSARPAPAFSSQAVATPKLPAAPAPAESTRPPSTEAPGIADFIDSMLSQQKAAPPSSSSR